MSPVFHFERFSYGLAGEKNRNSVIMYEIQKVKLRPRKQPNFFAKFNNQNI